MFFMLFAFLLPYLIDSFRYKIGPLKSDGYKKRPLFITALVMLLMGLINPYGIDAITYIFKSYGNRYINSIVVEMLPLSITDTLGKQILLTIFIIIGIYIFYKKSNIKPRYFYLLLGTLYLTFSSYKGHAYLLIGGILPLACYLKPSFKKDKEKYKNKTWQYILNSCFIAIILLLVIMGTDSMTFTYKFKEGIDYLLENNKRNDISLYTGYTEGGYPEWLGIKCYMDARAESF